MKAFFLLLVCGASFSALAQNDEKSEMALLMVKMLKYLKTENANIQKDKKPQPLPKSFTAIKTATPTAGKKLLQNHEQQSESLLALMEVYAKNKDVAGRKHRFNLIVQSCIECHKSACPGPIAVIEKQRVN